jgi:cell division transport system ATP-binding protein
MNNTIPKVIELFNADIVNHQQTVLKQVTLTIEEGEFVYLIGKTGSGKSSLLKTIYGELPLKNGEGRVAEFDLRKLNWNTIPLLRRKLGIVFQDFNLFNDRTVFQNLSFVLEATGWSNKNTIKTRVGEVLECVGLSDKPSKMPYELSGGEQQRVAIARALLNKAPILIADEPTGNLDHDTADDIMLLLRQLTIELNTGIIMATHNTELIERFPARVVQCAQGTLSEQVLSYF